MVVCADEKSNLQPRPRLAVTKPARPGQPIRLEHGYKRAGAGSGQKGNDVIK